MDEWRENTLKQAYVVRTAQHRSNSRPTPKQSEETVQHACTLTSLDCGRCELGSRCCGFYNFYAFCRSANIKRIMLNCGRHFVQLDYRGTEGVRADCLCLPSLIHFLLTLQGQWPISDDLQTANADWLLCGNMEMSIELLRNSKLRIFRIFRI